MFQNKQPVIKSFEDLVSNLEQIEVSELESDVRANIRAEIEGIRRNVFSVLSFLNCAALPHAREAQERAEAVRRQCLLVNKIVFRILLLQMAHLPQETLMRQTEQLSSKYQGLANSLLRLCEVADPPFLGDLAIAVDLGM
jgi:hypothetical protein